MSNIRIIKSPWDDIFCKLISQAKNKIYLASPFIKEQTARVIKEKISGQADIKLIMSFKLANFHKGISDINALKIFNEMGIQQKNVSHLHAKFFIFDNTAIVTSANLTPGGLKRNFEYGILIEGNLVKRIEQDYMTLFNNIEYPFLNCEILRKAEEILNSVPQPTTYKQPELSDEQLFSPILREEFANDRFDGGTESIVKNLSAWKRSVFECLMEIESDVFELDAVYKFEQHLHSLYPQNQNIRPKIRQQLQYLRDLGLLEFVSPGLYRKLWKQ